MSDESLDITAVTYQRVSTKKQASVGGRDEGFSIPAQFNRQLIVSRVLVRL